MDAGGVFFSNVNEETPFLTSIAERYEADPVVFQAEVAGRQHEYESDERTAHEVLADCLLAAGGALPLGLDEQWADELYLSCVSGYGETFAQVERVRREHPRLRLALANNEAAHWDRLKNDKHGHFDLFEVLCSSWVVGEVKPSKAYFDRALERCGGERGRSVLIDDRPAVVAAAEANGLHSVLLEHPSGIHAALDAALERLGTSIGGTR
ncbi:putative hydrolase of the HAD superfamily [Saccharothrix australiensis]|uniref:Putative hydrolase of the HAD superfamily n=2 Tax=Saccharothrix australiensis TaxID=2072 RepID=A0A495W994_9PSEU|nr:putative hydrolase of the HAD superfamily [Saccharothrix australiensis]